MCQKRLPWDWRSRIEIVRYDNILMVGSISFEMLFKKGQTPRGFRSLIGGMDVSDESPYFIESVSFHDYFQRRGLGTLLYVHVLDQLGSLSTHYHAASDSAQGLWRRLVRTHDYKIDFFAGTLTIVRKGGSK